MILSLAFVFLQAKSITLNLTNVLISLLITAVEKHIKLNTAVSIFPHPIQYPSQDSISNLML
uniref:Uncharacterized protein n=1 Tax=Cannabis sativa TaxID=3483 RepID=A0A803R039_CANSA